MAWADAQAVHNNAVFFIYGESATLRTPDGTETAVTVVIHDPGNLTNPDRLHISEAATVISIYVDAIGRPPRETEIITAKSRYVVDEIDREVIGVFDLVCRDAG